MQLVDAPSFLRVVDAGLAAQCVVHKTKKKVAVSIALLHTFAKSVKITIPRGGGRDERENPRGNLQKGKGKLPPKKQNAPATKMLAQEHAPIATAFASLLTRGATCQKLGIKKATSSKIAMYGASPRHLQQYNASQVAQPTVRDIVSGSVLGNECELLQCGSVAYESAFLGRAAISTSPYCVFSVYIRSVSRTKTTLLVLSLYQYKKAFAAFTSSLARSRLVLYTVARRPVTHDVSDIAAKNIAHVVVLPLRFDARVS